MFHILIVEDHLNLLEALRECFSNWFSDSKIETASTVDDALLLIEAAHSSGWPYDAAILDMRLPRQLGLQEQVHDDLCRNIRDTMDKALVIHITGYVGDPSVLRNLTNFHQHPGDPRSILVDKADVEYLDKIEKTVKAYLYGGPIEEQMNNLFGPYPRTESDLMARGGSGGRRSNTLELANLSSGIAAHWDDLDEKLQDRIRDTFNVNTEPRPIRISLLG